MSVSALKSWADQEILTHTDLNAEFANVYDNGEDLAWPATKAKDLNGQELILDADGDTSITADTDDRIDFKVAGADIVRLTSGVLFVGDLANTGMTQGVTIHCGTNVDEILALKSGNVAHGLTDVAETDTFGLFKTGTVGQGGELNIIGLADNSAVGIEIEGVAKNAAGAPADNANAPVTFRAARHGGDNTYDALTADDAAYAFQKRDAAGAATCIAAIDAEGQFFSTDTATVGTFDVFDDAALLRSRELERAQRRGETDAIRPSRFDGNRYSRSELEALKIIARDKGDGSKPLDNITQTLNVAVGALLQFHGYFDAFFATLPAAERANLRAEIVARGLPTQILDWPDPVPA